MLDDFRQIIDEIRRLPDPARQTAQTAFIAWCVARVVYTIVCGVVVWALGRRLIQAVLAASREAKRSGE